MFLLEATTEPKATVWWDLQKYIVRFRDDGSYGNSVSAEGQVVFRNFRSAVISLGMAGFSNSFVRLGTFLKNSQIFFSGDIQCLASCA